MGFGHDCAGQVGATATASAGVYGSNLRTNGGMGVRGVGFNGTVGETNYVAGFGVYGENFDQIGTGNGIGVAGKGYWGVVGEDRYLGTISGAYGVFSNGTLGASGLKTFQIDHPDDPANYPKGQGRVAHSVLLNAVAGSHKAGGRIIQGVLFAPLPPNRDKIGHWPLSPDVSSGWDGLAKA